MIFTYVYNKKDVEIYLSSLKERADSISLFIHRKYSKLLDCKIWPIKMNTNGRFWIESDIPK